MQNKYKGLVAAAITVGVVAAALVFSTGRSDAQAPGSRMARGPDGKPNLNGVWQAMNTANWDIEDHAAEMGPLAALGAWGGVPGGQGVVEGGEIPYKPEALAKKKANLEKRLALDPEAKCFLPGVPRAMYMPYPFQIVQTRDYMLMVFEYAAGAREIDMKKIPDAPVDTWMGYAGGRWDGDTLVIDTKGFNDQTWFDRAGNFHSAALHVVERITPITADAVNYEATIEDPNVFTRPWKISMPLYRRLEKNVQLLEYKCVEFAEEFMYGDLKKPGFVPGKPSRGGSDETSPIVSD